MDSTEVAKPANVASKSKTMPERPARPPKNAGKPTKPTKAPAGKAKSSVPVDPEAMFKVGFLHDVYKEREAEHVVTRCSFGPNEPIFYCFSFECTT